MRNPWPDLRALAGWPALREIIFSGNILAFEAVRELSALEFGQFHKWVETDTPLRDLRQFPLLPKIKRLNLQNTASLADIERYQTLLNLEIGGPFYDLSSLLALPHLTFLKLIGEHFMDIAPPTRMPKLREIVFVRERPLDVAVLSDAPVEWGEANPS